MLKPTVDSGQMRPAIALDEIETWPASVLALAAQAAREGHDRSSECYSAAIEDAVHRDLVVAFHCTRLAPDEIDDIKTNGLRHLDLALVESRLAKRIDHGELSAQERNHLLKRASQRVKDSTRHQRIWATLSIRALSCEDGFRTGLTYWGGESLLDLSDLTCDKLKKIGTACIVEFAAPVSSVCESSAIGLSLLNRFLFEKGLIDDDAADDVCFDAPVPMEHIRRIVLCHDELFQHWTSGAEWREALT